MSSTTSRQRPLSPFLTVYRFQYTMALSILHRITGCALSVGLLLFVYWLVAAASGAPAHEQARAVFGHPLGKAVLSGLSLAFFYHLFNGARHLAWDTGHGLERRAARTSGWVVVVCAVIATALLWVLIVSRFGGSGA